QPDAANPVGDEPSVLPRREALTRCTAASEQEFAWFLSRKPYVVIDRLAGLLRQFELDGLPGLLLAHGRPINCIPARCDVLDLERHDIAAAQLAVYCEVEHRQISRPPGYLEFGANRPDMFRPQRRLLTNQLP